MNSEIKIMKRTANFTATETDVVISLVQKYKGIIECLKTATVNAKMKKNAWLKIQDEFKSHPLIEDSRTAAILKNKYNIKRNVKKQYSVEKIFRRGTGGGPTKSFQGTFIASTVGETLQNKMTGERSIYDSDICKQSFDAQLKTELMELDHIDVIEIDDDNDITLSNIESIYSDKIFVVEQTTNEQNNEVDYNGSYSATKRDWTNYSPADFKSMSNLTNSNTAASDGHLTKKKKTYQDKITSWASTRASLSEEQKTAFIEQHKLKLHLMQEKHDVELKMMNDKHNIEIENLQLTNEILQLQKETKKKKQFHK